MARPTVLIALDGTKLSEHSFMLLPLMVQIGVQQVVLVRAAAGGRRLSKSEDGDDVQAYLDTCAQRLQPFDIEIRTEARIGDPAREILRAAEQVAAGLILIATHGRDGVERLRLGSVTDAVVRKSKCPALVIGPNVEVSLAPFSLRRILVPLDGSDAAERAVPVAASIARKAGAEVDLVKVAPLVTPTTDWGYEMDASKEQRAYIGAYLARVAATMPDGVVVQNEVIFGEAPNELVKFAARTQLVVLESHTRSGLARSVLGSVADRLLHGPAPVLVLNPGMKERGLFEG